jgi:SWI/SNF-related matrix-associated actin-dependent regulator of chromatin subfamily A member 5
VSRCLVAATSLVHNISRENKVVDIMPKEDRSDWVAVAPEFSQDGSLSQEIKRVTTAYQYFQKEVSAVVKEEIVQQHGAFDIAKHGRAVRDRWNTLSKEQQEPYLELQRTDQMRFNQESHQADVAAMERRERLQRERANTTLLLDDEHEGFERTTRKEWDRRQRKKARIEEKRASKATKIKTKKPVAADDEEFNEEDEDDDGESSGGSFASDGLSSDSSSSEGKKKKKKAATSPPRRAMSQKQIENRERQRKEKIDKETYIASRQDDLRRERADQAKRRLEFLLKQSDIFSHFGRVKEDTVKYGIKAATTAPAAKGKVPMDGSSRRGSDGYNNKNNSTGDDDDDEAAAMEEADEHEATFLTHQPSTLAFGSMRQYQLEGLNWMIRYV